MEEMIYKIEEIVFSYEKKEILNVDKFEIAKGRIYGLIGSNGSGKTTLMKILNGLLKIKRGDIYYKNLLLRDDIFTKLKDETVYIHQNPYLFNGSVFYNLSYGLRLRKIDKDLIKKRVCEVLELIGMEGFEDRRNRELSIGEIQKIAIARGLILNPDVILLDEPTANIDSASINKIESILFKLKEKNKTIIFSSHNSFFSYKLCDEIIKLENGRVIETSRA